MRDERILRELELDAVSRLYARGDARVLDETAETAVVPASAQAASPAAKTDARIRGHDPAALEGIAKAGWQQLRTLVAGCDACGLCTQRKQAVFGVGSETAPWLFVGEGPGADEDEQGDPFVGQAGKLLDAMLAAVGCKRGREVYIANVVKCRPPGNRTPTPGEAAACAPFLDRQVELVGPKLIVALGKTAATRLLGTEASLASLRGRVHSYKGIPVVVTYHPAYLLRTLPDKAKAWEDLVFARRTFAGA